MSQVSEERLEAVRKHLKDAVIALDFDGTLSPIVDDPAKAHIHPDAAEVLVGLASRVRAIAVVTGRPARQVLDLGGLEEVADAMSSDLYVFGQYGNERWTSSERKINGPRPPVGLATFLRELPRTLREADAADAYVEEKGLAVAVHTRRMADPEEAFARLLPVLTREAEAHDLTVEPGKAVIEVRADGMDKGLVVDRLITRLKPKAFVFAGDDLGDLEAFETVGAYAEQGLATLLVCSGAEQPALVPRADFVVDGPGGVLDLLRSL